jgi:tetratricopeptide (TPR) repeat protein
MFDHFPEESNPSLTKFEQMLKTNRLLFFDAMEFENIIHHYIDFAQFSLAKKALKMGMEQHPQNVELMLLKSEMLMLDGADEAAEKLLVEIEKLSPQHEEIYFQRANICSKKKDHTKAIGLLEKALEVTEEPTEVWNLMGMEYLFLENYLKAKEYFYRCIQDNQFDYQSLYNLLYCFEQLEEDTEAINTLNELLETHPYSEIAWHQLGKLYVKLNKCDEALSAFDFAIISDDCFTGAYIEKGKLLEKMGRINEAIENYEISLNLTDSNAFVNHRIGLCHLKLGNDQLAVQHFKASIKLEPNHEKSWIALIDYFFEAQNLIKAQYYVRKSLQANADSPELWSKSALIHFEMNLYDDVVMGCETAIHLGNFHITHWILWMDALMLLNDWKAAVEVARRAIELHKNNKDILYRLAGCKFRMGQKEEALSIFETVKNEIHIPHKIHLLFPELVKS